MIYDTASSILQFYGFSTFAASLSATPQLLLTDHHMILFTFLMGGFVRLGEAVNNQNAGYFLYILLQFIISNYVLARVLVLFKDKLGPLLFRVSALYFALMPQLSVWQITMSKDSVFSIALLSFCCCTYYVVKHNFNVKASFRLWYGFNVLLCCFSKHQGVYILCASCVLILILYKRDSVRFVALTFLLCFTYSFLFLNALPYLGVSNTGRQETLGTLFQQTARYVRDYEQEVTEEEKEKISKLLPYDELPALYNPKKQDPVKFRYNQSASGSEIKGYLSAWFSMFLKHPTSYIKAVYDISRSYFVNFFGRYNFTSNLLQDNAFIRDNFTLHNVHYELCNRINKAFKKIRRIPVVGFLFCYPVYSLSAIAAYIYLLISKRKDMITALSPVILSVLILIICPVSSYRYFLPVQFGWPIVVFAAVHDFCSSKKR